MNALPVLPDVSWINLAVALGIGLLIGAERERRKGNGASRGPAGIRTFTLVALLGAASAAVSVWLLAAALVAVAALAVAGYLRSRSEDPGLTSEVTLLLTLVLGAWSLFEPAWAAALAVITAVLLVARAPMHRFVKGVLTEQELNHLLVLAVATLLVLPLMPDTAIGPYQAIHPRALWLVVILVMSISAAGHVALRLLGNRWGLPLAGLLGGFVSSTATIGAMGARAADTPALLQPAIAGAVLSTMATMVQMAMVLAVTHAATLRTMALPLLCAGAAALACGALVMWRGARDTRRPGEAPADLGQAFSLKTALMLALVLAVVSVLSAGLSQTYGAAGLGLATALAGFADTHAPAVSVAALAASGAITLNSAAFPILLALTTNTISKSVVAFSSGGRKFALGVVPGLLLVIAAGWGGWWLSLLLP
jgi:uncharacterized membrane protein (DUF4010 family)